MMKHPDAILRTCDVLNRFRSRTCEARPRHPTNPYCRPPSAPIRDHPKMPVVKCEKRHSTFLACGQRLVGIIIDALKDILEDLSQRGGSPTRDKLIVSHAGIRLRVRFGKWVVFCVGHGENRAELVQRGIDSVARLKAIEG